jgi:hypothetical protein
MLNNRGISRAPRGAWDKYAVNTILNHPKYSGCVVFNRTSRRLGAKNTRNPVDQWIVTANSFEPIISPERFDEVRKRRRPMLSRSDEELIADLRKVLEIHGKLTVKAIRTTPNIISPWVFWERFGSMGKAYEAAGYKPIRGYFGGCITRKNTQRMKQQMISEFLALFRKSGLKARLIHRGLNIKGLGCVGIEAAQWLRIAGGRLRWEVRTGNNKRYGRMIIARISPDRRAFLDYLYLEAVPRTNCNFRVNDRMLDKSPRGTPEEIVAAISLFCK